MKKNFIDSYGYGSTLFKSDVIFNDVLPEVKPVRGLFVNDLSIPIEQPIDYNPIPPFIDVPAPPIEQPEPIVRPKFVSPIFIDDNPPPLEQPIEMPIEQPIQMPIQNPKFVSPIFIDDMPPPIEPIIELPVSDKTVTPPTSIYEALPISLNVDVSPAELKGGLGVEELSDLLTKQGTATRDTGGFVNDSDKSLPIKQVSKNLKPYIYAGLGIVAILIVSRILTKKN
jgi:hypothetical protein